VESRVNDLIIGVIFQGSVFEVKKLKNQQFNPIDYQILNIYWSDPVSGGQLLNNVRIKLKIVNVPTLIA
jgi:hypothetical protein